MKLINADLDKTITIRDLLPLLDRATFETHGEYFYYECGRCGLEGEHWLNGDGGTAIDRDIFEAELAGRLDLG